MTCIIALKTPNNVIIGSDRAISYNDRKTLLAHSKVIKKSEQCYIGTSGSSSIHNNLEIFELPDRGYDQDAYDYMINNFVPALRNRFSENLLMTTKDGFHEFDGTILVVLDGRIFEVSCRFSVIESSSDYLVTGSGTNFALGSLHSTDGFEEAFGMTSRARVLIALEAAAANDPYVSRPFDIIEVPV